MRGRAAGVEFGAAPSFEAGFASRSTASVPLPSDLHDFNLRIVSPSLPPSVLACIPSIIPPDPVDRPAREVDGRRRRGKESRREERKKPRARARTSLGPLALPFPFAWRSEGGPKQRWSSSSDRVSCLAALGQRARRLWEVSEGRSTSPSLPTSLLGPFTRPLLYHTLLPFSLLSL